MIVYNNLGFNKRFLLLAASLLTSSVLVTSPSDAATIAYSQGGLRLTNFSQSPVSTLTDTDTHTNATSIFNGGNVATKADAIAYLGVTLPVGFNTASGIANGENRGYLGLAKGESKLMGVFDVDANTDFSFDYTGSLNLGTSVDNSTVENASARGNISFLLIDIPTQTILESFNLARGLTTKDNNNFFTYQQSDNVGLSNLFTQSNFNGKQEFSRTFFNGSVQRYFNNKTSLAVIGVTNIQASVSAPEPSTWLSSLFSCGAMGIGLMLKRKHQNTSSTCLSAKK